MYKTFDPPPDFSYRLTNPSQSHHPCDPLPSITPSLKRMPSPRHRMRGVISAVSRHTARKSKDNIVDVQNQAEEKIPNGEVTFHDLTIQFIGANGIPKMDVVGSADPYFIADLDDHLSIV